MKTVSIRSHFLKIVLPIAGTVWLAMTGLFTWNDYRVNMESRLESEELIADTFIIGIRQPLIQGSFIEAKIRASSLLKSKQVSCIDMRIGSEVLLGCEDQKVTGNSVNEIKKSIRLDENSGEEFGSVSMFFDNSDLLLQCLGRLARSAVGFAVAAILLFVALTRGMTPVKEEIDAILAQARQDPFDTNFKQYKITEFATVSLNLRENMKIASQVVQANASLAVAKQVAHDIRSPVASMKMLIEELKKSVPEQYVNALGANTKRISEIVSDLIERNEEKVRTHFEVVCAHSICEEILTEKQNIHRKAKALNLSISNKSENSNILINPSDFRRVLSNLLDNSIEACPMGGNIKISLKDSEKNLEITIADNGKGISDDVVIRLFKPGVTYGKTNGKGLGLAHAKSTIEAAGGKVSIFSQVGVGTELKIILARVIEHSRNNGNLIAMNI